MLGLEMESTFGNIIEKEDIANLTEESLLDIFQTAAGDPFAALNAAGNVSKTLLALRDRRYLSKIYFYLKNSFPNIETQHKFLQKISVDNKHRARNIQRILNFIEIADTYEKLDYFAKITRYLARDTIDLPLFFKFIQTLDKCTAEELDFLLSANLEITHENSFVLESLRLAGLIDMTAAGKNQVKFTPYAKIFKNYCLDEERTLSPQKLNDVRAAEIDSPLTAVNLATDEELRTQFGIKWDEI